MATPSDETLPKSSSTTVTQKPTFMQALFGTTPSCREFRNFLDRITTLDDFDPHLSQLYCKARLLQMKCTKESGDST